MAELQRESHEIPESLRTPKLDKMILTRPTLLQNAELERILEKHKIPLEILSNYFKTRDRVPNPLLIGSGISAKFAFALGFLTAHSARSEKPGIFKHLTSVEIATLDKNLSILGEVSIKGAMVELNLKF